ncbi:uncharacterized protein HaLaN_20892 [Haematococcus lacustris]|uniref:Dynein heavy chain hydrolytic ATP-binding dynein motor region domain-containing protein n=1 Tax=Haematococcus lacustris TaxID=44745 RepID=A0A699ZYC2_HAELA|nr:uncharacterized protein HaLaN_20892 [Haematococcus lacustris]
MTSMEGESVELTTGAVRVSESVEAWLAELAKTMKSTLAGQLESVRAGLITDEFRAAASQTLCLKEAVAFTDSVESALQSGGSKGLSKVRGEVADALQRLAASDYTGSLLLQLKKQAMVIDLIHYQDIMDQLLQDKASSTADWVWARQLRYYAQPESRVGVAMAEASFEYTWEYQGNAPKLVYTPLTDKCYLTLTQGMALGYGGNPYGPAGTGKTESVKALGQALGRQEFDFKSMGRIFVGLVKCGAWGCFDEFNRLDEEVLSAVSQQIQTIQGALKEGAKTMEFMDKSIEVDRNAGIFVTLNPAGKGYGGRSKLPDNLKQLFRSIAMSIPDNELIAEVLLVSEGFRTARDLARKMVALFTLSRELLSSQQHYDWGLRALKTSLGIAGRELREVTDSQNAELEKAIHSAASSMHLELTPQQVEKMLQLHLACEQRIGVILVGPSGSGKSTLWEVLEKAYERMGRKPVVYKMNPKAMARQQVPARRVVKEPLEQRSWIVCDGDVDPEWIESLNSVLDDNRLLTMPNGERIQFANNINFIFECHSLEFASPATVSRCGMLFMSDEALDIDRLVARWLAGHKGDGEDAQLAGWLKDLFKKPFTWALAHPSMVDTTKVGTLDSALSHLALGVGSKHDFVCCLARGLSANMSPETRTDFLSDLARSTGETAQLLDASYGGDPLACLGDELREGAAGGEGDRAAQLVVTQEVAENLAFIAPWLKNRDPFILVGPEGCGKSTLLDYCFQRLMGAAVAVVNCSAQTSAANVIQKLVQVCGKPVTTNTGKCLRPPDNSRIILYLKDINLPRPDKYNTSQLVSFLQQLLTHEGYYDEHLEFIRVERIQV